MIVIIFVCVSWFKFRRWKSPLHSPEDLVKSSSKSPPFVGMKQAFSNSGGGFVNVVSVQVLLGEGVKQALQQDVPFMAQDWFHPSSPIPPPSSSHYPSSSLTSPSLCSIIFISSSLSSLTPPQKDDYLGRLGGDEECHSVIRSWQGRGTALGVGRKQSPVEDGRVTELFAKMFEDFRGSWEEWNDGAKLHKASM